MFICHDIYLSGADQYIQSISNLKALPIYPIYFKSEGFAKGATTFSDPTLLAFWSLTLVNYRSLQVKIDHPSPPLR
jgi:hypothetical protein